MGPCGGEGPDVVEVDVREVVDDDSDGERQAVAADRHVRRRRRQQRPRGGGRVQSGELTSRLLVGRGGVDGLHRRDVDARHAVGDGREELAEGGGDGEALKRSHRMSVFLYRATQNLDSYILLTSN